MAALPSMPVASASAVRAAVRWVAIRLRAKSALARGLAQAKVNGEPATLRIGDSGTGKSHKLIALGTEAAMNASATHATKLLNEPRARRWLAGRAVIRASRSRAVQAHDPARTFPSPLVMRSGSRVLDESLAGGLAEPVDVDTLGVQDGQQRKGLLAYRVFDQRRLVERRRSQHLLDLAGQGVNPAMPSGPAQRPPGNADARQPRDLERLSARFGCRLHVGGLPRAAGLRRQ
ncbi:hypothetical protein [Actinomadura verrucosospora]